MRSHRTTLDGNLNFKLLFLDSSIVWSTVCHEQLESEIMEMGGKAIGHNVCQSFHTLML